MDTWRVIVKLDGQLFTAAVFECFETAEFYALQMVEVGTWAQVTL